MLILTRKVGESIIIANSIQIEILNHFDGQIKMGIRSSQQIVLERGTVDQKELKLNAQLKSDGFSEAN